MTDALSLNTRTCQCCNFRVTPAMVKAALIITAIASALIAYLGTTPYLASIATPIGSTICLLSLIGLLVLCCRKETSSERSETQATRHPAPATAAKPRSEVVQHTPSIRLSAPAQPIHLTNYSAENLEQLQAQNKITDADVLAFQVYHATGGEFEAHARDVTFFYYNCDNGMHGEGCTDYGWGCAWRSIQTCASSLGHYVNFQSLFTETERVLNINRSLGSHDWAEPGYALPYLPHSQLNTYKYTDRDGRARTIKQNKDRHKNISTFTDLVSKMRTHFETQGTPIMIDDGHLACTILGIKKTPDNKIILWIGDTHKTVKNAGLYYLVLNADGNKESCSGTDITAEGMKTSQDIYPSKGWMLLFPNKLDSRS